MTRPGAVALGAVAALGVAVAFAVGGGGSSSKPPCHVTGKGLMVRPLKSCTPGEWIADADRSVAHVCGRGYNPRPSRALERALKRLVLVRFGLRSDARGYESDHLFPVWLGGATTERNVWPEPNYKPFPNPFTENPKDRLELAIYRRVCVSHTMTVAVARRIFEGDWRRQYPKYVAVAP